MTKIIKKTMPQTARKETAVKQSPKSSSRGRMQDSTKVQIVRNYGTGPGEKHDK